MKGIRVKELIMLALFADIGFVSKRLISPLANVLTDFLRVPGGIGTAFSLMFLVIGACLIHRKGSAAIMGLIQCITALSFGMSGAMGLMSPVGYIVPGMVIDFVLYTCFKAGSDPLITMICANALGAVSASLTANFIVFRLHGPVLALYVLISVISGGICGMLAHILVKRLRPAYQNAGLHPDMKEHENKQYRHNGEILNEEI